jgi:tRNA(His) 5'-end guanylyltransferase
VSYGRPWTEEEDEYLTEHWGLCRDETVARRLGRTVMACEIRAKRVAKVNRRMAFYTAKDVSELLGVNINRVIAWIKAGTLTGRRSVVRRGWRPYWRVDYKSIERFVEEHPELCRVEKLPSYWRN